MSVSEKNLKSRSIISVLSLFFQSGYSAFLGLIANLFLTILLGPEIFGIYIIVLSLISVLNYFSDIGLAASLIQRNEITDDDISTAFTVQQFLVVCAVILGFIASPLIVKFYPTLPHEGIILYWTLLMGFFMSSLKTIPSVFLERKIQYQKIVFVQILENTAFYVTVIILAYMHFGLLSFAYGVLLRSILGVIAIYSISFWRPMVGINKKSLKHLLSFGLPFQSSSFLALFKDDLVNIFLGKVIGFQGLGYIGWAKKWGEAPLRIIMDSLSRVMFPVFSRVQNDQERLKRVVEKILRYQTMILFPANVALFLLMPSLVELIPRYKKWEVAVPLLFIFVIAAFCSSFSTPFINLFNALGKVKISFIFMVFWTAMTWVLVIPLTKAFALYGYPIATLLLSFSFIIVLKKAQQYVQFRFISSVYQFILSGILMGIVMYVILHVIDGSLLAIIVSSIFGGFVYFVSLNLFFKINPVTEFITLIKEK